MKRIKMNYWKSVSDINVISHKAFAIIPLETADTYHHIPQFWIKYHPTIFNKVNASDFNFLKICEE